MVTTNQDTIKEAVTMTFEQFEKAVFTFRNDVKKVSKHGDYCDNKSKTTLGIVFIRNGKESKVYNYSGTYGDVLVSLGIEYTTPQAIEALEKNLEHIKETNGKKVLGRVWDRSKEIAQLEKEIEIAKTTYIID